MLCRVAAVAALAGGAILLAGAPGGAHVFLDRAQPRVGSTVRAAPSEVRLWFTGDLEPAFSRLRVLDATGARVDRNDGGVDRTNRALLHVSLVPLAPGRYTVIWRVVSVDSHVTQGEFGFRVAP